MTFLRTALPIPQGCRNAPGCAHRACCTAVKWARCGLNWHQPVERSVHKSASEADGLANNVQIADENRSASLINALRAQLQELDIITVCAHLAGLWTFSSACVGKWRLAVNWRDCQEGVALPGLSGCGMPVAFRFQSHTPRSQRGPHSSTFRAPEKFRLHS